MNIEEAIYNRRTIRRFKQEPIQTDILKKLIDYARIAPSGMNIQALEYIIIYFSVKERRARLLLTCRTIKAMSSR